MYSSNDSSENSTASAVLDQGTVPLYRRIELAQLYLSRGYSDPQAIFPCQEGQTILLFLPFGNYILVTKTFFFKPKQPWDNSSEATFDLFS